MSDTIPVLVVGAGPAGLVLALSLAQNGIKVRIIDKVDVHHIGSRGHGIQPRSFELFQTLGIIDDVQEMATPIPTMRAYKLPGGTQPVKTWDLFEKGVVWPDRPYANGACLSQTTLEQILRTHLAKYDVTVELSKGVVAINQTEGDVRATIAIHKSGQPTEEQEIIVAKYLVGADGAKGSTRKLLGLTFQGETRDADGMVWGDVEIQGLTSDYWHVWGKPGHFSIMARPLTSTGNKFNVGILGQNFDPTELAEPEKVKHFIHTETGRTDLEFGEFTWLSYFRPNMRMVNKFKEGRTFVVGDAAHVHSPTGGQGLNCSIQDASNLAWKLSLDLKGIASPTLLSSFNSERLPVITQMLHATTALYTHTVAKEKPVEALEKGKTEDEKASGWLRWRNNALMLYGINYRYSDIIVEERDMNPQDAEDVLAHAYVGYEGFGTLRAGDRAPEAPGLVLCGTGVETSLFKLLKPSLHTVLIFSAENNDNILETMSKYSKLDVVQVFVISSGDLGNVGGANMLIDRDGHAYSAYLVEKGVTNIVVVRPDAFIGAIVKDARGVDRYFAKVFKV